MGVLRVEPARAQQWAARSIGAMYSPRCIAKARCWWRRTMPMDCECAPASKPDRSGVQKIEQRRVQLIPVLELRQRDTLALRGIAWRRLRPVTALRHVDGSRLVFSEIQSWHGADTAN